MNRYILLLLVASCGPVQQEGKRLAADVVDCTTATALRAITEFGPTVEQVVIDAATGAGDLDWSRVKSATKAYATDAARCVLASTIARLMKPPASSPDAPQSAGVQLNAIEVAKGWDRYRAVEFGGLAFKLEGQ